MRRTVRRLGAVLAAALFVAACGGDDNPAPSTSNPTSVDAFELDTRRVVALVEATADELGPEQDEIRRRELAVHDCSDVTEPNGTRFEAGMAITLEPYDNEADTLAARLRAEAFLADEGMTIERFETADGNVLVRAVSADGRLAMTVQAYWHDVAPLLIVSGSVQCTTRGSPS